jgi:hypothetical protein
MNWKRVEPFRPLAEAFKPEDMRAAIERARMESAIVRQALDSCRCRGMSAEDTYTVLAYHALQALAATQRVLHEHLVTQPLPMFVPADRGQG